MDGLDYYAVGFGSYVETKQSSNRRNNEGKSEISSHRKNYRKEKNH